MVATRDPNRMWRRRSNISATNSRYRRFSGWEEKRSFKELLSADPEVTARLDAAALDGCFDPAASLRNMGVIFERVAALEW